jgi:hemoglobin-like flavoprotein
MTSLTAEKITLVQQSFALVADIPDTVASLFYNRLFELDPSLRPLFKGDLTEQGRKLMQLIAYAVRSLKDLEALVPAVQQLGHRHVRYGVKREHYDTVGVALLWTLGQGLGEHFTSEVQDAWATVYVLLTETATAAAYTAEAIA